MNNSGRIGRRVLALMLAAVLLLLTLPISALAAPKPVTKTVYFTLTNNGRAVVGNDTNETVLSHLKVEVPYFDLGAYGLQDYYRYESEPFEQGGKYTGDTVLKQPTVLHLYIYMLEKYCVGIADSKCMTGADGLFLQAPVCYDTEGRSVNTTDTETRPKQTLALSGSATSMYMYNFWGHDENLMYYIDHQYPLMAAGWGSTADYILLEDGMNIDVAMFTDWSFWNSGGAFAFFDRDEYYVLTNTQQNFTTYKSETIACNDGSSYISTPISGLEFKVYSADGKSLLYSGDTTDDKGNVSYTFEKAGDYQIVAQDTNCGTKQARFAPATAIVHVMDESPALTGVTMNVHEVTLDPAEPLTLKVSVTPENASGLTYKWESSDENVAHVSEIGVVKTYIDGDGGDATITCTVTDDKGNSFSDSCQLTVKRGTAVESVSLPDKLIDLKIGESYQIVPTVLPENASQKTVQWRTSECPSFDTAYNDADYTILKVDQNGKVTLKNPGVVTVYCKTDNKGFVATTRIAVSSATETNKFGVLTAGSTKPSVSDALFLLRTVVNKTELTDRQNALADLDGDNSLSVSDVLMILRCAVNGHF